ncbi:hypothetical protein HBHAL_2858 [Halobacillus halophilus DSM 2266]|uniref:Uncharacterized protein n=1 Tax=Halobacillus halophilus (strain ATCC 35676 / DSM 2266 / JCM 20832 / KCTC 3685 / LMG 17431 / NBRC 102448 / NCIMB 2269) TaxID=866895 RepID=I0JM36_HALH3|nr:hypothetical protein HBHAL_2858 [Halobacillus halophilus DSM 2266]
MNLFYHEEEENSHTKGKICYLNETIEKWVAFAVKKKY